MGFDGSPLVVTRGHGGPDDKTPTKLGNLNVGSMLDASALAGCTGTDVELIHGQQWQERTGDRIMNLHGSLKGHVFQNETWTIDDNYTFTVTGKTIDNRVGVHHQTNTNPRFDHFIHTRTETHDQPQVIHQPTTDTHTIWQKLEWSWEKHAATLLYLAANGVKLELDGFEGTEKVVVIERKEFQLKNEPTKFTIGGVKTAVWGFMSETVPAKLYIAAGHIKTVATNIAAGIRAALSAPWGRNAMHFGRAVYAITSNDVLTVISPIDYLFCGALLCVSVIVAILLSIKYGVAKPAPWIWNALGTLLILGLVSSNATVKLDAQQGKVYITRVLFYYPTREVYDLAALQGAVVGASDQSDALQLVFSSGVHTQLTPYTQMDGKNQAAAAINAFVQKHGGPGVEY